MSNEEINRKIAEACGWKKYCLIGGSEEVFEWAILDVDGSVLRSQANLPDYCSDLNAMHAAEETLIGENQRREYVYCLADLMKPGEFTVLAPAHSRALAFLKTVAPKL